VVLLKNLTRTSSRFGICNVDATLNRSYFPFRLAVLLDGRMSLSRDVLAKTGHPPSCAESSFVSKRPFKNGTLIALPVVGFFWRERFVTNQFRRIANV
jgi:hypothetical protein